MLPENERRCAAGRPKAAVPTRPVETWDSLLPYPAKEILWLTNIHPAF